MLKLSNYSYEYIKGSPVVTNLNMEVMEGDVFAFVGQNGAGKTTTIKSIVGITEPLSGKITLDDIDIKKKPLKYKQNIAYVPDNPTLYEHLTGIQYLNFIADMYEVSEKKREEKINKYAKELEIYDDLGDLLSSYSHGMKQKIAIIAALVHDPKLYIFDEPFVGLDPKSSVTLKKIFKKLAEEKKIIFFSTHVLDVAEKICNKLAIIKDGKIVVSGNMKDIIKDKSLEDVFMELTDNA